MNTSKIIKGVVSNGRYTVTAPIVKEDYGLYLQIEGVELPSTYEVDFSNSENNGTSVTMIGNADGVLIPRQFIDSGKDVFAFLYHVGTDFGRTVYKFRIPNKVRPDRTDEEPTPEEQSTIDQAISALNTAVEQTAQDKADADASAQNASADADRAERARDDAQGYADTAYDNAVASSQSAQSAEQSAQTASAKADAITGLTATAQTLPSGSSATASYDAQTGVLNLGIPTGATGAKGDKGDKGDTGATGAQGIQGAKGDTGADGYSPTVTITPITGGHRITIADADGEHSADVMDGTGNVEDVQINGSSIVTDGVANVPTASASRLGVVQASSSQGIYVNSNGVASITEATSANIKTGTNVYKPITPHVEHEATFYGLAKAAGDTTQSQSSNAVGNYTDDAKIAIQKMLGLSEEFELINVVSIDADASQIVCNTDMSGQQFSLKAAAVIIYAEPGSEQTGNATLTVGFSPIYNQFSSNFEQLSISAGIRTTPQKNFGWAKVEGIIPEIRTDSINGTSGYITMLECGTFAMSEVKRCAIESNNANANGYIQTIYVNGNTFGAGSFIRVWGVRA